MRPELAEARRVWIEQRQPDLANMLERLVFIDEIEPLEAPSVRAPRRRQTFIAVLGCDGLVAPWVLGGAMNRNSFETYVAHELAPALRPGQIVRRENCPPDCFLILLTADNLSSHKSARAIELLRAQGNDLILLPRVAGWR